MNTLQILDPLHVAEAWMYIGAKNAAEFARAKANEHKVVGMSVMADLLEAEQHAAGAGLNLRNITLATEHGFNAFTHKLSFRSNPEGVFLQWEPLDSVDAPATTAEKLGAAADSDNGVAGT